MGGLFPLDVWDIVIEDLRSTDNTVKPSHDSIRETCARQNTKTKTPTDKRKHKVDQLSYFDYVPTNTHSSQDESQLHIFGDNEAVIKMIMQRTKSNDEDTCPEPT